MKLFYDSLLSPGNPSLARGQSHTWDLASDAKDAQPMKIYVDAAIFGDGIAVGDSNAIESLWDRRKWLAVGYQEILRHIDTSVQDIDDRDGTVAILTQIEQARIGPNTPREERDSISLAYETVIGNLRDNHAAPPSKLIAILREQANTRIKAIQSQIAPVQVKQ